MPRTLHIEETRLLTKVSKLYYEESMLQDQIVARLNLSRSKISRLLRQARELGIVQITVLPPSGVYPDIEYHLEQRFQLQEALVVDVHDTDSQALIGRELGIAAANYLQRCVADGDIIGITWGNTLSAMVDAIQPTALPKAQVVQMVGGLGPPESEVHATDLVQRMARRLGSRLTLLPAPGIVDNQHTRTVFLTDSHVQSALQLFDRLDITFVGIGAPNALPLRIQDSSTLTQAELNDLIQHGAVGDIGLRFFDIQGKVIDSDVDKRVIGIELEQLSKVKKVVGVAGGLPKVNAILGGLRSGAFNVLITDHATALALLEKPV